jgi:Cof subfamily protein (haloacid dehalogenase superfamily)
MIQADVKLVATDLDGTLLGPEARVTRRTAATLQAVADAGVEVIAITGRSHRSAAPLLSHIPAIRWVVCSNGASLYDQTIATLVDHVSLPEEELVAAIDTITGKFHDVGFAWETPAGLFHSRQWAENRRAVEGDHATANYTATHAVEVDDRVPSGVDVLKLLVIHDNLTGHDWFEALAPHVPFGLFAATSGAPFVEITAGRANKGAALARMCRWLGVDRSATVAFGDNGNDVEMLRWAGRGYAMANAHPAARAAAVAVAPRHDHDGVARVLEDLLRLS